MRPTLALIAVILTASLTAPASAQDVPTCRKGEVQPHCLLTFGRVNVQVDSPDGHKIRRAIVFSDDMRRDSQDFVLAVGFLMISINPASSADERGELLNGMMIAPATDGVKVWSGYVWKFSYSTSNAIRVIAERL